MTSFFSNMRGFGRQSNKGPQQPHQQQNKGAGVASSPVYQTSPSLTPLSSQQLPNSPAMSSTMSFDSNPGSEGGNQHRNLPFFFREKYATLIVKGNFMTLAAKPVLIEEGEWLAHQVVEQNRLLDGMLKIIQEQDRNTGLPICNTHSCPAMTAGNTTYTWLNNNKESVRVPAPQYISYVQKWITGKVTDPSLFPTETFSATTAPPPLSSASADPNATWLGKSSNFPPNFGADIRNIYRQMLRCYAHIYHSHWMEFWHLGAYKELNTCFIHFVNVGRLFGLLGDKELEPMMPLIDIWLEKGWLPRPASSGGSTTNASASAPQQQQSKKENFGDQSDRRDMQPPQRPASSTGGQ
ncbi:hypothetical protein AAFC00_005518 [Neodothiora populina]|uniref:Mob1/phocein n=1 Tax=Neodothiora populina TaxID=2781224 RepID=A0ABR3PL48_9PEZI